MSSGIKLLGMGLSVAGVYGCVQNVGSDGNAAFMSFLGMLIGLAIFGVGRAWDEVTPSNKGQG